MLSPSQEVACGLSGKELCHLILLFLLLKPMTETQWPENHHHPPPPPPLPPMAEQPTLTDSSIVPSSSESSTKPPSRPKKIRKLPPSPPETTKPFRVIPRPLSAAGEIDAALRHLRSSDPALAALIDAHDPPSFSSFLPPFLTLARSIINQQLAFKAAASTYSRFISLCGGGGDASSISPAAVLSLSASDLRQIGISSRKARYLHDLARKFHSGVLSDELIVNMDDKSVLSMLTMVEGIGVWSVHMFLIFSLHRPDVLPVGDGGVRRGVQILYGLEEIPRPSQMEKICERWRPYRSVGSWYMWRLSEAKANGAASSGGEEVSHQSLLLDNIQVGYTQQVCATVSVSTSMPKQW